MRAGLILLCELICALCLGDPSFAQDRVRIAYVGPSLSNLPLLAAKETGIFARHKLDVEILLLTSQLSAVALGAVSCAEKRLQRYPRSRLGRRSAGGWFDHNDEDIKLKSEQVVRIIKSLQIERFTLSSKERAVDFTMKVMKMDRESALRAMSSWLLPGLAPAAARGHGKYYPRGSVTGSLR